LVVDEIHDTGKTLKGVFKKIEEFKPKSIEAAILIIRPDKHLQVDIKFKGLTCGNFIIGYGLDFNEFGRYLPDIYQKVE
jgi:hypoxanthine phosphoribosyltransferase